jgi:hypothetical protein
MCACVACNWNRFCLWLNLRGRMQHCRVPWKCLEVLPLLKRIGMPGYFREAAVIVL